MDRSRKLPVAVLLFVVLTGVTACSSKTDQTTAKTTQPSSAPTSTAPPATQPASPAVGATTAAPASAGIQSQDTNTSGVVADVIECKRKEGVLSIKIRFRNVSSPSGGFDIITSRNYQAFYLVASNKKYLMLQDSDGTYLTPATSGTGYLSVPLEKGQAYVWWAKFPAPPGDVTKLSIFTPVTPPFEDVPITDQQ